MARGRTPRPTRPPTTRDLERRQLISGVSLATVLCLAQACAETSAYTPAIEHPIPDSLVAPLRPARALEDLLEPELAAAQTPLRLTDSSGIVEFLAPVQAERDTYAIVDKRDGSIRLLAPDADAGTAPRIALVPYAKALVPVEDGMLVVAGDGTVAKLNRTQTGWTQERAALELSTLRPIDACAIADTLFIHGTVRGRVDLIHAFEISGRHLRSFGIIYRAWNPVVHRELNRGTVACDSAAQRIYLALERLPIVAAFATTGTMQWAVELPGFHVGLAVERGNTLHSGFKSDTVTMGGRLVTIDRGRALAQTIGLTRHVHGADSSRFAIITYLIDTESGNILRRSAGFGRVLGGTMDNAFAFQSGLRGQFVRLARD